MPEIKKYIKKWKGFNLEFKISIWLLILILFIEDIFLLSALDIRHNLYFVIIEASISSLLILGLFFLKKTAKIITQIILWATIFISMGYLSPFNASDMLIAGIPEPSMFELIFIKVGPYVVLPLWFLHILGKYKKEFK